MDKKTLALLVKGIDEASGILRDIKGEVQGLGSEAATTAQDLQPLGRGLSAVGAAGAALISITALTAARVEVLGTVLHTVGETAGYTEGQLDSFEEGVTRLGITTGAARQGLVQMMQAELDLAEATDIASIAQDSAVIANVNSSAAYETLVRGILTGRSVLLKSLGLTVDFNAAYKHQAELLGKSTLELSANEKMQARLNEVKRAGAIIEGTYEAAMGDVGKKLTSMPRLLEEAAVALGQAYLPAMEEGIDATSDMLKAFIALDPEQQAAAANFIALGTAIALPTGAIILALPQIIAIGSAIGTVLASAVFAAIAPFVGLAAAAVALYAILDKVAEAAGVVVRDIPPGMDELAAASIYLDGTIGTLDRTTQEAFDTFNEVGIVTSNLTDGWNSQYSPALINARELTDGWATSLVEAKTPLDDLGASSGYAATRVGDLAVSTGTFAKSLGELTFKNEAIWEMALAAGANNEQMMALAVETGKVDQATADLTVKGWKATEMWVAGKMPLGEYIGVMQNLRWETALASGAFADLIDNLNNLQPSYAINVHTTYTEVGVPPPFGPPAPGPPMPPSLPPEGGGPPEGYQYGTDYVPETGMYLLHEGEAVIPAGDVISYQFGTSGPLGQTYTPDPMDVARMAVAMHAQEEAVRALAAAQQELAANTDPKLQFELEGAVARATLSLLQQDNAVTKLAFAMETASTEAIDLLARSSDNLTNIVWDGTAASAEMTIASYEQEKALRALSIAQEELTANTDPERQLELEAGVARATLALLAQEGIILELNRALLDWERPEYLTGYHEGTPYDPTTGYQHGTPYVPSTGWAYLHEGEAVLTREENRQRGEGGTRVTVINNFGRESVRTDEDIQTIIEEIQSSLELQGLRDRIA